MNTKSLTLFESLFAQIQIFKLHKFAVNVTDDVFACEHYILLIGGFELMCCAVLLCCGVVK